MNIIITMAGLGSRFRKAGYNMPKYMIEAKGKTLFEWSMDSLTDYNDHVSRYIFVVRKEDSASEFIREKCKIYNIKSVDIIEIDYLTDGQATTAILGLECCDLGKELLIYNIDTYVETGELNYSDCNSDGCIPCFHAEGTHWSFVKLNEAGQVVEVREKERISDNCTLGAYYFKTAGLYKSLYDEYYINMGKLEKNEKYIAPLYNYLIEKGGVVTMSLVEMSKVHVLGTPEELEVFLNE